MMPAKETPFGTRQTNERCRDDDPVILDRATEDSPAGAEHSGEGRHPRPPAATGEYVEEAGTGGIADWLEFRKMIDEFRVPEVAFWPSGGARGQRPAGSDSRAETPASARPSRRPTYRPVMR